MEKEEKGRKGRDKGRREAETKGEKKKNREPFLGFISCQSDTFFSWFLDPVDGSVF